VNALRQLESDILEKIDGCAFRGAPDRKDWVVSCAEQSKVVPPLLNVIAEVKVLSRDRERCKGSFETRNDWLLPDPLVFLREQFLECNFLWHC